MSNDARSGQIRCVAAFADLLGVKRVLPYDRSLFTSSSISIEIFHFGLLGLSSTITLPAELIHLRTISYLCIADIDCNLFELL